MLRIYIKEKHVVCFTIFETGEFASWGLKIVAFESFAGAGKSKIGLEHLKFLLKI